MAAKHPMLGRVDAAVAEGVLAASTHREPFVRATRHGRTRHGVDGRLRVGLPPAGRAMHRHPATTPWHSEQSAAKLDAGGIHARSSSMRGISEAAPSARSLRHGTRADPVRGFAVGAKPTTAGESVDSPSSGSADSGGEIPDAKTRTGRCSLP
jgi:hypothetical protein